MNKRDTKRTTRRLEVKITADDMSFNAFTSNVSEKGIFVRTMRARSIGTVVDIELSLPSGKIIKLRGRVKWALKTPFQQIKNGMGIQLIDIPPEYTEFIKTEL